MSLVTEGDTELGGGCMAPDVPPRCAGPITAAGPRLGLGSGVGLGSEVGLGSGVGLESGVGLVSLGRCFGGGLVLGGRQEGLPETRAPCQQLRFTDVSLWLFNRGHTDPAGRKTARKTQRGGSPSIPLETVLLAESKGCRTRGWWVSGVFWGGNMGLEKQTSAPRLDEPTGTSWGLWGEQGMG